MDKGAYYTERAQYIADLEKVLLPIQDFNRLKYVHEYYADTEYLQLTDKLGGAIFIDITTKTLEEIFKEVSRAISGQTPKGFVREISKRRHIAELLEKIK